MNIRIYMAVLLLLAGGAGISSAQACGTSDCNQIPLPVEIRKEGGPVMKSRGFGFAGEADGEAGSMLVAHHHATDECSDLTEAGERGKLPGVRDRDRIFACAGISELVVDLDHLDKDLLFLRARVKSVETLQNASTETDPPRRYADFLPAEKLLRLIALVEKYRAVEVEGGPR